MANDTMDILGGFGLSRGPNNYSGNAYMNLPIAITVEGANILTRSLIIFGQGLVRSHPNLINIINSIEKGNDLAGFKSEVLDLILHAARNSSRSLSRSLLRPRVKTKSNLLSYYEGQLSRLAANFAVCSDLALVLGGRLKTEEMLSGRFADAFGSLYLGYSCLWNYHQNENIEGINSIFEMAMETLLKENQDALLGIADNFPVSGVGSVMRLLCFPAGESYRGPDDNLRKIVSSCITKPSPIRDFLTKGTFITNRDADDKHCMLESILKISVEADATLSRCKKDGKSLSSEEVNLIKKRDTIVNSIIQVDEFTRLGTECLQVTCIKFCLSVERYKSHIPSLYQDTNYIRPALRGTRFSGEKSVARCK